jgi:hypothetical protein
MSEFTLSIHKTANATDLAVKQKVRYIAILGDEPNTMISKGYQNESLVLLSRDLQEHGNVEPGWDQIEQALEHSGVWTGKIVRQRYS